MSTALGLAFAAGMVSTLNPCGFAMLPAYLAYFMGIDTRTERPAAVATALRVGLLVSAGFIGVFGVAGLVFATGGRGIVGAIPWLALVIGVGVAALGLGMLFGYAPRFTVPRMNGGSRGRGTTGVIAFGLSFAVASLSCALPVFLSVVATNLVQRSVWGGLAIFAAFAAGMAVTLIAVTVVVALGRRSAVQRLRTAGRYVTRISGAVMLGAGGFITWFWATELSLGATALGGSLGFRAIEDLSQRLLNLIADNTAIVAAVFSLIVAFAVVYVGRSRTSPSSVGTRELETATAQADGDGPRT